MLSFDIDELPQASQHSYTGQQSKPKPKQSDNSNFLSVEYLKHPLISNCNEIFYTIEDVKQHNTQSDCWTVYEGLVYDMTEYAPRHPGGAKIFAGKGKDCTEMFKKFHSPAVRFHDILGKH